MEDWLAIDVVDEGHQAFLEFIRLRYPPRVGPRRLGSDLTDFLRLRYNGLGVVESAIVDS